jgi:Domain of unknown function (DUF6456)
MRANLTPSVSLADQRRLLRYLARDGAFALTSTENTNCLNLYRTIAGVTIGGGTIAAKAASDSCAKGILTWISDGARLKLVNSACCTDLPDHTTPAARQAAITVAQSPDADGHSQIVVINRAESPLAWLHCRKDSQGRPLLSAVGFSAGERLRSDMDAARTMPRLSANWEAAISSNSRGPSSLLESERAVAARQRVDGALNAVGPEFSGVLVDVCGFLKSLPQVEMEQGWPPRSARIVLGLALTRLAHHYDVGRRTGTGTRGNMQIRTWHANDVQSSLER